MSQVTVQLPDPVLEAARKLAAREKVTVEELVARMVGEAVRLDVEWELRVSRGRQISRARFLEIIGKAPDAEPEAFDRID